MPNFWRPASKEKNAKVFFCPLHPFNLTTYLSLKRTKFIKSEAFQLNGDTKTLTEIKQQLFCCAVKLRTMLSRSFDRIFGFMDHLPSLYDFQGHNTVEMVREEMSS
jgi:hypothetical protein